ncbi:MAG: SPOR domain-containing protein [Prevotella sp.]|nr:SPOR domain-containing protein [Prevotella sp.]MBR4522264.1 SPOR domain-containing protein [Prevotella sp.]
MKKFFYFSALVCTAIAFTACSSSKESAYRKAYEKAKAQEQQQYAQPVQQPQQEYQAPVQPQAPVTPMVQQPVQQTTTVMDNTPVRRENVNVVSGSGLKAYSVVVGSFGVRANADGLQNTLRNAGYDAQIAYNSDRNMYRVIATTHDDRSSAVSTKESLKATYPDAWLLMK